MTTTQMTATKIEPARITVAKMVRGDLKAAFPGVKFSVTSERSTVNIDWSMGPSAPAVEALVGKYEAGYFDGSDDSYKFRKDDPGHPTVMYIFARRDTSSVAEQVARDICAEFGEQYVGTNTYVAGNDIDTLVHRALMDADLTGGYHGLFFADGRARMKAAGAPVTVGGPAASNDNGAA